MADQPAGSVLVVVPCLNEEAHLPGLLTRLLADEGCRQARIVIADGRSSDRSRSIVEEFAARDGRVVLLDNPDRIQSAGINLAVEVHGQAAEHLIRVDAHAGYPDNFVRRLVEVAVETGADSVVTVMHSVGHTCFQVAAATAQNSVIGTGGSSHRSKGDAAGRWIDHGHHAYMKIAAFREVGGYDAGMSHNEDAELDVRLVKAGRRIWLYPGLEIEYYPRTRPVSLFRQYFNYGKGRAITLTKHRIKPKPRQMLPIFVAPALVFGVLLAPVSPIFLLPALAWLLACAAGGLVVGARAGGGCAYFAGLPAGISHVAWSLGFIRQVLRQAVG